MLITMNCQGKRCAVCSRMVCTEERCWEHRGGSQLTSGEWVCSSACWERAVGDDGRDDEGQP